MLASKMITELMNQIADYGDHQVRLCDPSDVFGGGRKIVSDIRYESPVILLVVTRTT